MLILSIQLHHICTFKRKHSIYRAWYDLQFEAATGGLGTNPPWIRAGYFKLLKRLFGEGM